MRNYRKQHVLTDDQRKKDIARSYAGVYKRRGLIVQIPCVHCGNYNSQMHHEDYSKPTIVMWLCRECHMAMH